MTTDSREGHRDRLRKRYLLGGIRGFSETDALELLLTYALPRIDVKPLARCLLDRFGSLRMVLSQSPVMLRTVTGIGPAASVLLSLVPAVTALSLRPVEGRLVVDGPSAVRDYLAARMGTLRREALIALLLDSTNTLIAECPLEFGTVDRASVHPRNLLEKIIATGATGVILVHNHPGGAAKASQEDINMTRRIRELGESLGFRLLDHMIVAAGGTLSLKEEGILD
jgi:DNA repair protein RadC